MSSNTMHLTKVQEELTERLTSVLPAWTLRDMTEGLTSRTGVVLYLEQGDFTTKPNGDDIPPGFVGCEFDLTVAARYKDPVKGKREATEAAATLCTILDSLRDVYWTTGRRGILTTGEPCYLFPIVALARYTNPTDAEEATE